MTAAQLLPESADRATSPWFTTADRHHRVSTDTEALAAYAALYAGAIGVHAPHRDWIGHLDGTAQYAGSRESLTFSAEAVSGGRPAITAVSVGACGASHTFPVASRGDLEAGRAAADECTGHATFAAAVVTLADAHRPADGGPADTACWCEDGGDPYQCPAAEFDECEHQAALPELSPLAGRARERDAKVVRCCPWCAWTTSSWRIDDGSAEEELYGHVRRAHRGDHLGPASGGSAAER
ncbi:hypothetical protein ACIF6L_34890 [Kitasatospora sp. NPDC086009]|uniref:hypothetical protein n=1 Tax=unclassified Kitasatospora TaxID=2633591 RepID=UPI0037C7D540